MTSECHPTIPLLGFVLHATCIGTSAAAFFVFRDYHRRRNRPRAGTFSLHLLLCVLYSVVNSAAVLHKLLDELNLPNIEFSTWGWKTVIPTFMAIFTYISGAVVALDRILVISLAASYVSLGISKKLCVLVILLCASIFGGFSILNFVLPLDLLSPISLNSLHSIHAFGDVCIALEALFHAVFCFQYYRFFKRQNSSFTKKKKINQIVVFQSISLVVLCLIPTILDRFNHHVYGHGIRWIFTLASNFYLLVALDILLFCSFIVHKLRPRSVTAPEDRIGTTAPILKCCSCVGL